MANLPETEAVVNTQTQTFVDGVYQFELTDAVQGGENGIDNRPTKTLANRTLYLLKELFKKAPINSPTFTGTPNTTSPAAADNSTRIPNTNWVRGLISAFAPINSPTFTGTPNTPSPAAADNSARIPNTNWIRTLLLAYATTSWVNSLLAGKADVKPNPEGVRQKISTSLSDGQSRTASLTYTPSANGRLIITAILNVSSPMAGFGMNNTLRVNGVDQDADQTQSTQVAKISLIVSSGVSYNIQQVVTNVSGSSSNPFSMILHYEYLPL